MIFKNLHLPSKLNIFVPPNELITQQLFGYESIGGGGGLTKYLGQRTVMEDLIRFSFLPWCKLYAKHKKKPMR